MIANRRRGSDRVGMRRRVASHGTRQRHPRFESLEERCLLSGMESLGDLNLREFSVMSCNAYIGGDLNSVIAAGGSSDPSAIPAAVAGLWNDVLERDFPARAEALADEIAAAGPILVGMQEVASFVAGDVYYPYAGTSLDGTGQTLDFLDILLQELDERGLHYTAIASTTEFGGVFPALVDPVYVGLQDIQYFDRDVILARSDLPAPAFSVSNVQTENFATNMVVSIGGETVPITRGWNSVDVQWWGQEFRFVNTHLEIDGPGFVQIQNAQAAELVAPGGPLDTELPVILVGDFNTPANDPTALTYQILTQAGGLTDSWIQTHPGDPGYTWADNPDLRGDPVTLDPPPADAARYDLVLVRGGNLQAVQMERVMLPVTPSDPATGPLWPSDHAGVAATIGIGVGLMGEELPWAVVNDDPLHPGEQSLFVAGTNQADQIFIHQLHNGKLAVRTGEKAETTLLQITPGGKIYVHAGAGDDYVRLNARVTRDAVIIAAAGDDLVLGGRGDDEIYGGDGRDLLFGRMGDDTLLGGDGADRLFGGRGNDVLRGGDGADLLLGGAGSDTLAGDRGNDWLFGGRGDDLLDGGDDFDWLVGGSGSDSVLNGEIVFS